ncbi:MAG: TA system antitoxin ParD family protein [Candidatus Rokuibacteriota bacterium]
MARGAKRSQGTTPVPVRFSAHDRGLFRLIAARASAQDRSLSGQIKHYARLGMIAEDNPDLPLGSIAGILEAQQELKAGLGVPYQWGVLNGHRGHGSRAESVPRPDKAAHPPGKLHAGR